MQETALDSKMETRYWMSVGCAMVMASPKETVTAMVTNATAKGSAAVKRKKMCVVSARARVLRTRAATAPEMKTTCVASVGARVLRTGSATALETLKIVEECAVEESQIAQIIFVLQAVLEVAVTYGHWLAVTAHVLAVQQLWPKRIVVVDCLHHV